MTLRKIMMLMAAVIGLTTATSLIAAEGKAQTKCPIRGGDIDKDVFIDHEGKRVYFCCPGCDTTFMKDAEANIKKMEAEGIAVAEAPIQQQTCVISGEPIDEDVHIDVEGERVYFCCKMCIGSFKKNAEANLKKVQEQKAEAVKKEKKAAADKKPMKHHMNH